MGLIRPQKVKVKWNPANKKHFESMGYVYTKKGEEFEVDVDDLPKGSHCNIEYTCDCCKNIFSKVYKDYLKDIKEDGNSYCRECVRKLFSTNKMKETKLKKSKSFAQKLIEEHGENALELYWDYEKNTVDPWKISYGSTRKVWIFCQEVDYHGSYEIRCGDFSNGYGCSYCGCHKVHPLDSLKQHIIDKHGEEFFNIVWSNKNTVDPSTIKPNSLIECWWNCPDGKHEPYKRSCNRSTAHDYRCPNCFEHPKGEDNPNWNPNLTEEDRDRYRSIEGYSDFIKESLRRDEYHCQCCNHYATNLQVHHLNGYNWFKEGRTDINNAITLCKKCHKEFHDLYGRGNNTKEQFEEFLKEKHIDK